ncbi:hypothetical protein BIY21_08915 [Vibrio ponticus]|uniref:Uncharacterized protein n=1 Tax=Vibrio ponticus TaxID=265668 RepID=A0ABX3FJP5_9VIBR|nr:hypothetical protein [Vibrio ponticus]OLQ94429.1 hypothetical protein BIY21_08915 [Vibrio ponticus]
MKKRLLPIPLILLIPILLLIVVVAAGLYRFSLDDEEILAKFPSQSQVVDPIVKQVFSIQTPNPWTIQVPESAAFAFIDELDTQAQIAFGPYDSGAERGQVTVSTKWLTFVDTNQYISLMTVSNQGSGVFSYLASFRYDTERKRVVLIDSVLIGDRIAVDKLAYDNSQVAIDYRQHSVNQPMSAEPEEKVTQLITVNSNLTLLLHTK